MQAVEGCEGIISITNYHSGRRDASVAWSNDNVAVSPSSHYPIFIIKSQQIHQSALEILG